jgi:hypothetical protein
LMLVTGTRQTKSSLPHNAASPTTTQKAHQSVGLFSFTPDNKDTSI